MSESRVGESVQFNGKSFCFTGKLAELKRTQAERETRARGGFTTDAVNQQLDYLVVGSIPATGWKFGDYGRKIATAMELAACGSTQPVVVSESDFMEALAHKAPTNAGAVDGKVQVVTYSFIAPSRDAFDRGAVEQLFADLRANHGCHVRSRVIPARARNELFAGRGEAPVPEGYLVFEVRVVRHMPLDVPITELVSFVSSRFEAIRGVDGKLHWFERTEGSADYIRLIREIPEDLRVPDL